MAGSSPCERLCSETLNDCVDACPDNDGDGAFEASCGGDDCDDSDPNRAPGNREICDSDDEDCDPSTFGFRDLDGDARPDSRCCNPQAGGGELCGDDCNDMRPDIYSGQVEACDGFDNDCDGTVDEGVVRTFHPDSDGDGFGDPDPAPMRGCSPPDGWVENDDDCDDTQRAINPAAGEACDGIDTNCNGILEGVGEDVDRDGDWSGCGRVPGDCDDSDPRVFRGAVELCDGLDNDCDGRFDGPGEDDDGDGYADAACGGDDCDDASATFHPGAVEVCDGRDTNCDGTPTIADADGDGRGSDSCGGDDCDDSRDSVYAGAPELCDGLDNDCNGRLDGPGEDDDGDGFADTSCGGDDCDDTRASYYPGAPEGCDGLDTNCDGIANASDDDGDGFGDIACGGTDCDDSRITVFPGAPEVCNGRDDDCDGNVDGPVVDCVGATPFCSALTDRCVADLPCGDGVLHPGEECDDGNLVDFDGCSSRCFEEPRLIRPPTAATASSSNPTLVWTWPLGPHEGFVEVCEQPDCATPTSIPTMGTSGRLGPSFPPGLYFWRVVRRVGPETVSASRWWSLRIPRATAATTDTSFTPFADYNCDGFADVAWLRSSGFGSALEYSLNVVFGRRERDRLSVQAMPVSLLRGLRVRDALPAGDLNGDGCTDMIVTFEGPGSRVNGIVGLGSQTGAISFFSVESEQGLCATHLGGSYDLSAAGDLDSDGYADLMCSIGTGVVQRGTRTGELRRDDAPLAPSRASLPTLDACVRTPVGDTDGDGMPDYAASCRLSDRPGWVVFLVTQHGTRVNETSLADLTIGSTSMTTFPAVRLPVGDFNGDGMGDFLSGNGVALGQGDGSIALWSFSPDEYLFVPDHPVLYEGPHYDVNDDGYADVPGEQATGPRRSGSLLGAPRSSAVSFHDGGWVYLIGIGDVDRDGFADGLAIGSPLRLVFGSAAGTSRPSIELASVPAWDTGANRLIYERRAPRR
ncbi:MAG: DUF4215 domain-containing protein [Sandaracinus sp.]|nr:DUF4215 domain-containing protein [Sandaracinus sp.]